MTRTTELAGPWTLTLAAVGDLAAGADAGAARIAIGLAQPGERERILAAGPPGGLEGRALPATVPGCVHLDLVAAGLLADPFAGMHESEQHWIGRCAWTYATTFPAPPAADRHELVLGGVDTVADVWLNGERLAELRNEHRTHRLDVTGQLLGENRLELRFVAQADWAEARRRELGALPSPYTDPINVVRTMACEFGWDWGPTLVTAGIWAPVRLASWSGARLAETRLSATAPGGVPRLTVVARVERARVAAAPATGLRVEARVAGTVVGAEVGRSPVEVRLTTQVPGAERWWPRSHGAPVTHPCAVVLLAEDGTVLDRVEQFIGFRDVAIVREADAIGESFAIVVNDRRIWVRGANWIPDDPFPSRVTPAVVETRVAAAVDANMDLLRVWGGGLYESDAFYDACDRAGILVWQDFPFACAGYPEDPDTAAEVEAEAREAIARLGSHPSLALWNGGNETTWGWFDWGWPAVIGDRPWGLGYWLDLLPRLVAELDPDRPYWPNSPWSGSMDRHPNDDRYGTSHLWEVWNDLDYTAYRDRRPRFAAEYGYQAPATWRTLVDAVGPDALAEDAPAMLAHQKAGHGRAKLRRAIDRRHPGVAAFDDWHFFTQLEQARALRVGIGHLRSLGERCTGSVVWQLNDTWPSISWALVDKAGRRKPAWYAVRDAYADRIVTIEPSLVGDGLELVLVNEHPDPWDATVELRRLGVDGVLRAGATLWHAVTPRSAVRVPLDPSLAAPKDPAAELLVADPVGAGRATWWFVDDHEVAGKPAAWKATADVVPGGVVLRITAVTLVRELCLFPDRLDPDATVDRMLVTLLPGETAELHVTCPRPLESGALLRAPVLRAANDGVRFG